MNVKEIHYKCNFELGVVKTFFFIVDMFYVIIKGQQMTISVIEIFTIHLIGFFSYEAIGLIRTNYM